MNFPPIKTQEDFQRRFHDEIWPVIAEKICRRHNLSPLNLQRQNGSEHVVFFVDETFVVKIYAPFRDGFRREKTGLDFARAKTRLPLPQILFEGEIENFDYLIFNRLDGDALNREVWLTFDKKSQIEIVAELAVGLKELHSFDYSPDAFDWNKFIERQAATIVERQRKNGGNPEWLARLPAYLEENLPLLPNNFKTVFLHSDVHFGNLRFKKNGAGWKISGLFDFADCLSGFHEYEFLAIGVLMIQGQGKLQREFFRAYGYRDDEIDEELRRRLMLLTILYECADLNRYARRLKPEAVNFTLDELERAIWSFCDK